MAVYTHVGSEDIAAFLEKYDVGTLQMAKGIAEGVQNTNYLLETTKARFILTIYEERVEADDLPFFLSLTSHLSDLGLPVPAAIASMAGSKLNTISGKPACLIQFLSGVSVTEPSTKQCFALGVALAKIRHATATFPDTRVNALNIDGWHKLTKKIGPAASTIAIGLEAKIAVALSRIATAWPRNLESGAIHADLFPDNVLFSGDTITGLIDFYFACTDIYAYDIAVCLNAWTFSHDGSQHYPARAAALLAGYASIHPLSTAESAALPVLCQGAALRFLLTRVYDWLNTPADALVTRKDPLAYLRRLEFYHDATG
jgi:homoserine kinase type II